MFAKFLIGLIKRINKKDYYSYCIDYLGKKGMYSNKKKRT